MLKWPIMNIIETNVKIKILVKKYQKWKQVKILEKEITIIKIKSSLDTLKSNLEMADKSICGLADKPKEII